MAPQTRGAVVTLFVSVLFIGQALSVSVVALLMDGASSWAVFLGAEVGAAALGIAVAKQVV